MRPKSPRAIVAALASVAFIVATGAAQARDIQVALDQSFPVRLAQSASGVAVGNPTIAAVSMQNDHLFFVTGRAYGTTNITVVDANNRVMYSGRVVVVPDETHVVRVTRGTETAQLECTPMCRPAPDIGDATFEAVSQQITSRASSATSSTPH
jgi:Flp pilus assembly secretin CpaC